MKGRWACFVLLILLTESHVAKLMNLKQKAIVERIKRLEEAIAKGRAYLESGEHAGWAGFRPLFYSKKKDGKELPPHRDWVKNVFLRHKQKALSRAEKLLENLT